MGFNFEGRLFHASDYFDQMYQLALNLIRDGKAYVCSLSLEEIRTYRGTVREAGKPSPYRDRSVAENLDLFQQMRAGAFEDGAHVLRAKIDMASPNMKMRDPIIYRIRKVPHQRTGDVWPIYPMYDWAHCLSDAFEGITHSICTLEFENNRELYDWIIHHTSVPNQPRQYEFARLNLNYTVMSKRKLLQLVEEGQVTGWDDPRMPTIAAMRRRGYTPASLQEFCERIGVAKANSVVDISQLEFCVRDDLNRQVPRVMAVLDPLKIELVNYPEDREETLDASLYPHDVPKEGSRQLAFCRELYIERSDFEQNPPKGFFRLAPGREVRLRHAYIIRCQDVVTDDNGKVVTLRCTYDPDTKGVNPKDRKVKGTIHWVSARHGVPAEMRLYDRLFNHEKPDGDKDVDFKTHLNPDSLRTMKGFVEPTIAADPPGTRYQFERQGYFCSDPVDSREDALVFNRTVALRDSWAKTETKAAPKIPVKPTAKALKKDPAVSEPVKPVVKERPPEVEALFKDLMARYQLSEADADLLSADVALAAFFEAAVARHQNPRANANWILNELLHELKGESVETLPFDGDKLGALVALIDSDTISGTIAKEVLSEMVKTGEEPGAIVEKRGLRQVTDTGTLEPVIRELIAKHGNEAQRYRQGEKKLLGFFMGQAMKATAGKANPKLVNALVRKCLDET